CALSENATYSSMTWPLSGSYKVLGFLLGFAALSSDPLIFFLNKKKKRKSRGPSSCNYLNHPKHFPQRRPAAPRGSVHRCAGHTWQ
uniref:Uncharacterized protein n=1 Tax=Cynoglossus semilaevis TaxID=244447 RepID=A0A3P8V940_CYNSE